MLRLIAGIVAGVLVWMAVVIGVSLLLRAVAPGVDAAMVRHATTFAMAERLAVSFLGSLIGGAAAALVAADRSRAPLLAGLLLLAGFAYYHVTMIWHEFPVWYHLTFFVSLPLLSLFGGRLIGPK
ncbi:MAG TPA: hypothetical protein VNU97_05440 [Rhizomicrobium sp.]|nr:hypothetical protein [Rhizomicrobium sp.]